MLSHVVSCLCVCLAATAAVAVLLSDEFQVALKVVHVSWLTLPPRALVGCELRNNMDDPDQRLKLLLLVLLPLLLLRFSSQ